MSILRALGYGIAIAAVHSLAAAETKPNVSTIVDKAAAESILGVEVRNPTPRNEDGRDGYYSKCNYYSTVPGKLLILRIYQAAPGFDPKLEIDQVRASSGLTKSISDLGDKAELSSGNVNRPSVNVTMLYVAKGNALVTVGLRGLDEETAIAKVKSIAQKILERL